jgi:glycosyltransferase involved in cell wall biosynthesis
MKVAYVVDKWVELSQTFVVEEVQELRRQGTDVVVVALHKGTENTALPAAYLRETPSGWRVHARAHGRWALRSPRRYASFLRLLAAVGEDRGPIAWKRLPWLAEQLKLQGVDRLHAHFAWDGATAAAALSRLTGWPWALTVHARDIYAPRPRVQLKLETCDLLVTVCRYNVHLLRDRYGLTRHVELVICGVAVPASWGTTPEKVDVIAVGRLVEKKGFDVLLRAFRQVLDVRPQSTLHVLGEGSEGGRLRTLAEKLDLGDQVVFAGAVPHDEVLSRIDEAAILCLPARIAQDGDADSMPVVIKEAMVRGKPVVATDVTAVPEMVDDEVGLLVAPEDDVSLGHALLRLLEDPSLRRALGRQGRERAVSRFAREAEVARLRVALASMAS